MRPPSMMEAYVPVIAEVLAFIAVIACALAPGVLLQIARAAVLLYALGLWP